MIGAEHIDRLLKLDVFVFKRVNACGNIRFSVDHDQFQSRFIDRPDRECIIVRGHIAAKVDLHQIVAVQIRQPQLRTIARQLHMILPDDVAGITRHYACVIRHAVFDHAQRETVLLVIIPQPQHLHRLLTAAAVNIVVHTADDLGFCRFKAKRVHAIISVRLDSGRAIAFTVHLRRQFHRRKWRQIGRNDYPAL